MDLILSFAEFQQLKSVFWECHWLPVCRCKACGYINLWGRGELSYKLISLSGFVVRKKNQHSEAHLLTLNTHEWCCSSLWSCSGSRCRVGRGGWWHHSPSRIGPVSKLQTHWAFIAHAHVQTPTAQETHKHCLFSAVRESRGCSTLPSHCCCGPALTLSWTALQSLVHTCVLLYVPCVWRVYLRLCRCQCRITKRFLWFRVDHRGDSVVRGERNVWQTSRVSASLSAEADVPTIKNTISLPCQPALNSQYIQD